MTLWLVRHAQPLVPQGVCYGAWDVPADAQATEHAAQAVASVLPPGVQVYCSPLQRCEQLAQCLRGLRPDLTYETEVRLAEMDFGTWEGQRWDALDPAVLQAWTDDFAHWRCGGGESVAGFMQRVAAVWDGACRARCDQVWLTHAGVIRAARLLSRGQRTVQRAHQWPHEAPAWGQWERLMLPHLGCDTSAGA